MRLDADDANGLARGHVYSTFPEPAVLAMGPNTKKGLTNAGPANDFILASLATSIEGRRKGRAIATPKTSATVISSSYSLYKRLTQETGAMHVESKVPIRKEPVTPIDAALSLSVGSRRSIR